MMKRYRHIEPLFALLFLAGCATINPTAPFDTALPPPPPAGPMSVPAASGELPDATSTAVAGEPLSLEDCIALALARNPEIAAVGWDAEAARENARAQGAERWPNIHLTGSYFHHQDTQRLGVPSPPGQPQYFAKDIVSADLVLRLPLYAGGRIVNEFRAAELLARAAEKRLARTREETAFNVTSTYYSILAQETVVASTEFARDTLAEHRARVESLIAAQKAARVDALRTGVRLADVEHQLLQARNTRDIQYRFLANLLGLEHGPAGALALAGGLEEPGDDPSATVDDLAARARVQRGDYAAARAALEAQARRVDAARGAREPSINLEASFGGRQGLGGSGDPTSNSAGALGVDAAGNPSWTQTTPLAGGGSWTATVGAGGVTSQRFTPGGADPADSFEDLARIGLTVDLPIFEGGRLKARVGEERARLQAARYRLRKLELDIRLEAETALLDAQAARERVRVSGQSIAEAEESLRIEREKYTLGKGAIVDVLDAQTALLDAQTRYGRALSDEHIARARIRLVAGEMAP